MVTDDPWYGVLADKYGDDYCERAGYFEETKPWFLPYSYSFDLPSKEFIIQYSGAFYPFHEGHLETIKNAVDFLVKKWGNILGTVIIHVDHYDYRSSKGTYSEEEFHKAFEILDTVFPYNGFKYQLIFEDKMPNGCSRNFTRLYNELSNPLLNNMVYFLCGGDRANYCFTFLDEGHCIIVDRPHSELAWIRDLGKYKNDRVFFVDGNNPTSSSEIRKSSVVL